MAKEEIVHEGAKAYAYTRVSTILQVDRYSLDAQMDRINAYAKMYGMEIVHEYSDKGRSGKSAADRPGFMKMMEDIEANTDGVTFVICYKLSRFGRKTSEVLRYIEEMQDRGVYLICTDDNIDTSTETGKLLVSILSIVAEMERDNILAQTMEGRRRKAREGKWNGGITPFGYYADGEHLMLDEEEAPIARMIFEKFAETSMVQGNICTWLNRQGYHKNDKRPFEREDFTPRFITRMLQNPVYKGQIAYGKTKAAPTKSSPKHRKKMDQSEFDIMEGACPAIVSEELWQAVQYKLESQSGTSERREKEHEYILGNLLRCPKCGRTMYGRPSKGATKNKDGKEYPPYYAYICRSYMSGAIEKCGFGQIACHKIDSQVRDILLELTTAENFAGMMEELAHEHVDTSEVEKHLEELKKKLRGYEIALDKLKNKRKNLDPLSETYDNQCDYLDSLAPPLMESIQSTELAIIEVETQLDALKAQILTRNDIYRGLSLFAELYDDMSDYEKKKFLRMFIDHIELYPDKSRKYGCYIKSIDFQFPVSYHGENVYSVKRPRPAAANSSQSLPHVESVVCLSRKQVSDYLRISVNTEDLETDAGRIYSNDDIKQYIEEKYGFKVHSAYIGQVREKLGIREHENYNDSHTSDRKPTVCPEEKEAAIVDALRHFGFVAKV